MAQLEYINHLAYLLGLLMENMSGDVDASIRGLPAEYSIEVESKLLGPSILVIPHPGKQVN